MREFPFSDVPSSVNGDRPRSFLHVNLRPRPWQRLPNLPRKRPDGRRERGQAERGVSLIRASVGDLAAILRRPASFPPRRLGGETPGFAYISREGGGVT